MGIYDREYYRGETRGAGLFTTAPVCRAIILVNAAIFLFEKLNLVPPNTLPGPFAASSVAIWRDTAGWVYPSDSAAPEKDPWRATSLSTPIRVTFSITKSYIRSSISIFALMAI